MVPMNRFGLGLLGLLLIAFLGVATLNWQKPAPQTRAEAGEREEDPRGILEFRYRFWKDENGNVPEGAFARAVRQMEILAEDSPSRRFIPNKWNQLGPINIPGRTRCVVPHPGKPGVMLQATAGGGIWRTENDGKNWTAVQNFNMNLSVSFLAADPNNPNFVLAGTGEPFANLDAIRGIGLYYSTNFGKTWTPVPVTEFMGDVAQIRYRLDGKVWVAAGRGAFLADSWKGPYVRQTGTEVFYSIAMNPAKEDEVLIAGNSGVYRRRLDTEAWTKIEAEIPEGRKSVAWANSNTDYAYVLWGTEFLQNKAKVFRSSDRAETFALVSGDNPPNSDWYSNYLWINPTNPFHIMACGAYMYNSLDGGANWTLVANGMHADVHYVANRQDFGLSSQVYVCTDGGLYGGQTPLEPGQDQPFTSLNAIMASTQVYGIAANSNTNKIYAGTQDNGTFRLDDNDSVAKSIGGGDGGYVAISPFFPKVVMFQTQYLDLYLSKDNGATATKITTGLVTGQGNQPFFSPMAFDDGNQSYAFVIGMDIYRCANILSILPTWAGMGAPVAPTAMGLAVRDANDANVPDIWIGGGDGRLYTTKDRYKATPTWTAVDNNTPAKNPLPDRSISSITVGRNDPNTVIVTFGGFAAGNIWASRDRGATWANISGGGFPSTPVYSVFQDRNDPNFLHAATEVGIVYSVNFGRSWVVEAKYMIGACVWQLTSYGNRPELVAGTHGRGIWSTIPIAPKSIAPEVLEDEDTKAIMTVTLTAPAPADGANVSLSSDSRSLLTVPSLVTVPPFQRSVSFYAKTGSASEVRTANVTAFYSGLIATQQVRVQPTPGILSFLAIPGTVIGGEPSSIRLTLEAPPQLKTAEFFTLFNEPSAGRIENGATFQIRKGTSSQSLPITTFPVAKRTFAKISVLQRGTYREEILTILPPRVTQFGLTPSSVKGGSATTVMGNVSLSHPAPPGGMDVKLVSSNPAVAKVQPAVTVSGGQYGASFPVTHFPTGTQKNVQITASTDSNAMNTLLTVEASDLESITLSAAETEGGAGFKITGRVSLFGPAGPNGALVLLSQSPAGILTIPSSVTVIPNATSATFSFYAKSVPLTTFCKVSAKYGASTLDADFKVWPALVKSFVLNRTSVVGGAAVSVTGTVTLGSPASPGGQIVEFLSFDETAAKPAVTSITIPAGQRVGYVRINHFRVGAARQVRILSSTGLGPDREAILTVNPG